jgi:hypothetical protein
MTSTFEIYSIDFTYRTLASGFAAGGANTQRIREQVVEEAKTALARSANFASVVQYIDATPDQKAWLEAHAAALRSQADTFAKIATAVQTKQAVGICR